MDTQKVAREAKIWGKPYTWPVIAVTGLTVGSIYVLLSRKQKIQAAGTHESNVPGYGRKSAEETGLMEGDRAFQGIFPRKKAVEALSGVLPATQPDSPSIEREPEKIKEVTPASHPPVAGSTSH